MDQSQVKNYWETRLANDYSLGGVGHLAAGRNYNYWIYKMREKHFRRAIKSIHASSSSECLDIGSGTGFYLDQLLKSGFRIITGSDLTDVAVRNLQRKYLGCKIVKLDITSEHTGLTDRYSLVTCMDVLFHIVDEEAYEKAFKNFNSLVEEGNYLIITENLTPVTKQRQHIYDRTREKIITHIERNGFRIIDYWSQFIFLNPPVQSSNKFLWAISNTRVFLLKKINSTRLSFLGSILGFFFYLADLFFLSLGFKGRGTSILVCKKQVKSKTKA